MPILLALERYQVYITSLATVLQVYIIKASLLAIDYFLIL
jgi:hypothetical protein